VIITIHACWIALLQHSSDALEEVDIEELRSYGLTTKSEAFDDLKALGEAGALAGDLEDQSSTRVLANGCDRDFTDKKRLTWD
jgi:hypothetical protein